MEFLETDVCERIELSLERIEEIKEEELTLAKSNPMFSNIKD